MGSIIGSIYPLDNIVVQEPSYRNVNININPSVFTQLGDWKAIMDKFGIDTTKNLADMKGSELRIRKRKINDALKVANDNEKKWLNWELDKIQNRLKEISASTWGDIWGGLVDISGAKPEVEATENKPTPTTDSNNDKSNKSGKTFLYVGIGVGVLALAGTVIYFVTRKKK